MRTMNFKNRSGAFVWVFTIIWLSMLVIVTFLVYRDGPAPGTSPVATWAFLAFFWLGGVGLAIYATRRSCFYLELAGSDRVIAVWRYPLRVVRRSYARASLRPAEVVESRDSEGDPYYIARIATADGTTLDIAEGHDRAICESACESFNRVFMGGMDAITDA